MTAAGKEMHRLSGVRVLAVLSCLLGLISILAGILLAFGDSGEAFGLDEPLPAAVIAAIVSYAVVSGVVDGVSGWGLWGTRRWAWYPSVSWGFLDLLVRGTNAVLGVILLISAGVHSPVFISAVMLSFVFPVYRVFALNILLQPSVWTVFGANAKVARAARGAFVALPFLLPSIVLFGAFVFYPLGKSIYLGFFQSNPFHTKQVFVGFDQYRDVLTSGTFRKNLVVTATFALYTVVPSIVIGTFLAVIANQKLPGIVVFRTIFSSTLAASVAITSVVWLVLLHPSIGVMNDVLGWFGVSPINWLGDGGWGQREDSTLGMIGAWFVDPNWALISVSLATMWMNIGLFTIIMLAGLQTIPDELYESARIDGAGRWAQFWYVTLPMLSPMLFFAAVVGMIFSFQAFGQIRILTQGGPVDSTNTLLYAIYNDGFENFRTGAASVEAIALFLILLLLTSALFRLTAGRIFYGGERA